MNQESSIVLGMGCFWGAEKRLGTVSGVVSVESGYAGGASQNPTYESILMEARVKPSSCHAEVVKVVFNSVGTVLENILICFWENHDPTQGFRQGNDIGANYRSAIFYTDSSQLPLILLSRDRFQVALDAAGYGSITTEIAPLTVFYPAEEYHQKYLIKNPLGYCGLGGTGVYYSR